MGPRIDLDTGEEGKILLFAIEHGTYISQSITAPPGLSRHILNIKKFEEFIKLGPPLWSSSQSFWLLTQRSQVRFPALTDFLRNNGSGTEYTQPLEDKEELLERKVATPVYKTDINDRGGSAALTTLHPSIRKSWH
jgi:hypothetical protein